MIKITLLLLLMVSFMSGYSELAFADSSIAGTYRCRMFNVGGAGKRCTSPALVLKENGKYVIGSEKGTWSYKGGELILSASKVRGPGRVQVSSSGMRVTFEYSYLKLSQTVTYERQDMRGAASQISKKGFMEQVEVETPRQPASVPSVVPSINKKNAAIVDIDVTIIFPDSGNVGWINGAAIMEEGESTGPETLANNDGKNIVTTYFRSMPAGRVYKIYVTTGFEKRYVGSIDLRNVTEDVKVKLHAK